MAPKTSTHRGGGGWPGKSSMHATCSATCLSCLTERRMLPYLLDAGAKLEPKLLAFSDPLGGHSDGVCDAARCVSYACCVRVLPFLAIPGQQLVELLEFRPPSRLLLTVTLDLAVAPPSIAGGFLLRLRSTGNNWHCCVSRGNLGAVELADNAQNAPCMTFRARTRRMTQFLQVNARASGVRFQYAIREYARNTREYALIRPFSVLHTALICQALMRPRA